MDLSHLMSASEAAERLEVSPDWIRKLCRSGKLDCGKVGRFLVASRKSVEEYANTERKRGPAPKPRRRIKGTDK